MAYSPEQWSTSYPINPLERLNKEFKRLTCVVAAFPEEPSVIRLMGAVLMELTDDW